MDVNTADADWSQWLRFVVAVHGNDKTCELVITYCVSPYSFYTGVAALNQFIYVVGGFDGTRQLASVERYDTEHGVWDTVAPISIARSALSVTSLDGRLYAMGGFDGFNFLAIVEVYDPELNLWEKGVELTTGRSGHASAVIYKPSSMPAPMDCHDTEEPAKPVENTKSDYVIQFSPPLSAARLSECTGSRYNECNDIPDASVSPTIPSAPSVAVACSSRSHAVVELPTRLSVIKPTMSSVAHQRNTDPALFTNPTSAFSAMLAVDRSSSPTTLLNDKKRVRVHSFNSVDAIPPKCPTPRDDHASKQVDREDPRKFRRIYNSGSAAALRYEEGACSSAEGRISSSPSGDSGIEVDPVSGPSSLSSASSMSYASSSASCSLFKGHAADPCSVKALRHNLQRRLRALVTGSRQDDHKTKAIAEDAHSRSSPPSPGSQDEEMDT